MIEVAPGSAARAFQRATGLEPLDLERVPRGYANLTYLVRTSGGRWLMKVTSRGAERVERAFRGSERARAGGVPTPRIVARDVSGEIVPAFWVQEHLAGEDAWRSWPDLDADDRERVARLYGEAVARMHLLPFREDERTLDASVRHRFELVLARLRELDQLDDAAIAEVNAALDRDLPLLAGRDPRLAHTDLHFENLLIPPDRPVRAIALLDFEQTRPSDPAEDFPKLLWWNWNRFPEARTSFESAYHAAIPRDPRFDDRVSFFCLYLTVASLRYFFERRDLDDPVRPYIKADNVRQLAIARERFARWRETGEAC